MELFKRCMMSSKPSWITYVVCVTSFLYLCFFEDWEEYLYDPNLAWSFLTVTVLGGLSVVTKSNNYILLCVFCKTWGTVKKSGWIRCVAFVVLASIVSYFLVVVILHGPVLAAWSFIKTAVVNTMEKNIVYIEDNRTHFLPTSSRFHERRQGEDSEVMQCTFDVLWPSDRRPPDDVFPNWTWSLNNKPISWTSRHNFDIRWTNLSENDKLHWMAKHGYWGGAKKATWMTFKNLGLGIYRAIVQLQIRYLESSDFGRYQCSSSTTTRRSRKSVQGHLNRVEHRLWFHNMPRFHWLRQKWSSKSVLRRWALLKRKSARLSSKINELSQLLQSSELENRVTFIVSEELVHRRRLVLPPGAMVTFDTRCIIREGYYDEIAVDVLVNSRSLREVTRGSSSYCSWSLLLYFWLTEGLRDSFLHDKASGIESKTSPQNNNHKRSKMRTYLFCLGPQTYGQWEMEVSGRFYDLHDERYKRFITILPFTVIILPRRQTLYFDLFSGNGWNWTEQESVELNRSLTDEELKIYSELAQALSVIFKYEEYFFFGTALLIVYYLVRFFLRCVSKIGAFLKKNVLEGPRPKQNFEPNNFANPNRQTQDQHYHVFLSHSEMEVPRIEKVVGQMKVERQRVFFPFHDIPPNRPILPTTDAAIEKSKRFVIFFSEDYLEENMFEAERIVHHVRDSGQDLRKAILVVKLDFSGLPVWLQQCSVQDWTAFGSNGHFETLNSWLGCGTFLWVIYVPLIFNIGSLFFSILVLFAGIRNREGMYSIVLLCVCVCTALMIMVQHRILSKAWLVI